MWLDTYSLPTIISNIFFLLNVRYCIYSFHIRHKHFFFFLLISINIYIHQIFVVFVVFVVFVSKEMATHNKYLCCLHHIDDCYVYIYKNFFFGLVHPWPFLIPWRYHLLPKMNKKYTKFWTDTNSIYICMYASSSSCVLRYSYCRGIIRIVPKRPSYNNSNNSFWQTTKNQICLVEKKK